MKEFVMILVLLGADGTKSLTLVGTDSYVECEQSRKNMFELLTGRGIKISYQSCIPKDRWVEVASSEFDR